MMWKLTISMPKSEEVCQVYRTEVGTKLRLLMSRTNLQGPPHQRDSPQGPPDDQQTPRTGLHGHPNPPNSQGQVSDSRSLKKVLIER
jgi:hypothetical protein